MGIEFPFYIMALITALTAIVVVELWLTWRRVLRQAPLTRAARIGTLLVAAFALAGWASIRGSRLPLNGLSAIAPFMLGSLTAGLLLGVVPLIVWPAFRQGLGALPTEWIPRLNAPRLAGFAFLALYDMKLLPGTFALPAGLGDMATAGLGLWVARALSLRKPYARTAAIAWNVLGLADFVTALVTGGLSLGPLAARAAAAGASMHYLNYVLLIPSLAVPAYISLHVYSLTQLVSLKAAQVTGLPRQAARSAAGA